MENPDSTSSDEDSNEWIVAVPIAEENLNSSVSVANASADVFSELTALQAVLRDAKKTGNESSVPINATESARFTEATKNMTRTTDEPGVVIRYDGELYRVYIMGLT